MYGPGYSWFDIYFEERGITFDEEQAWEALGHLADQIAQLPGELGLASSKVFVGGFSQGAAMTMGVIMTRPEMLAGAMILSGRMADRYEPNDGVRGLPVLVQHGQFDNVIPVENGRRIATYLRDAGAEVEHHEYPMGHEVSLQSLLDLKMWLGKRC